VVHLFAGNGYAPVQDNPAGHIMEILLAAHGLHMNGKVRRSHLSVEDPFYVFHGGIKVYGHRRIVGRIKKGKPLEVIPMEMGKKYPVLNRFWFLPGYGYSQLPDPRAAVKYDKLSGISE
jgi:hypothetical protein